MQTDETRAREAWATALESRGYPLNAKAIRDDKDGDPFYAVTVDTIVSFAAPPAVEREALFERAERAWQRFFYPANDCFDTGPAADKLPFVDLEVADCLRLVLAHCGFKVSHPEQRISYAMPEREADETEMLRICRSALLKIRDWQGEQNPAGNTYRTPIGFQGSPFDYLRKLANDALRESARIAWGVDEPTLHPSDREAIAREVPSTAKRIDVKAIWKAHGGSQHGPNVEQYYIEEQAFYRFASAYRDAILALSGSLAPEGGEAVEGLRLAVDLAIGEIENGNTEFAHSILREALNEPSTEKGEMK